MKELVEYIVKNLVSDADSVNIDVDEQGKDINILVKVAEADFGKVIGKNGKVANAIRTVARTSAKKINKRVNVKFTDK